jgi:hypothetical protein
MSDQHGTATLAGTPVIAMHAHPTPICAVDIHLQKASRRAHNNGLGPRIERRAAWRISVRAIASGGGAT